MYWMSMTDREFALRADIRQVLGLPAESKEIVVIDPNSSPAPAMTAC